MKHLFPLLAVMAVLCFFSCSEEPQEEFPEVAEDGLLLNDDLIAVRSAEEGNPLGPSPRQRRQRTALMDSY